MFTIDISPIAFTIGNIAIRWYGIMVAMAVLTVVLWALREVRRGVNLSYDNIINAALFGLPSGIIFARVFHIVDHWNYYIQNPGQIIGSDGLAIYGGVLGATLGIWISTRLSKISFGYLMDVLSPGIILSQAVGRVGCILNGCCYGLETRLPWAIIYTHPESFAPIGVPVHPTQVYEIIYNLIAFGVLASLRGRFKPDGSLFLIYLSLYSLWRIGIGFLREGTPIILGFTEAQIISLIILAVAIPILAIKTRRVKAGDE